jgi:hypothetical protein
MEASGGAAPRTRADATAAETATTVAPRALAGQRLVKYARERVAREPTVEASNTKGVPSSDRSSCSVWRTAAGAVGLIGTFSNTK